MAEFNQHGQPHDRVDIRAVHHEPSIPSPSNSQAHHPSVLKCCCGRLDCAYLRHNNAALEDLEKDLATAARLGQALLHRHETFVAEAEEDRSRLLADMEKLERDKQEMQAANARIVEENRNLLEQLEGLNNAVVTSDAQIKALTERLEQTHLDMRELAMSAARAGELESQLSFMEAEQLQLQQQLILTQEDERSAVQRWKKAECTLRDLQDQLDRLEYEARAEREQHVELVQRMERRRAVERELDGAAGRLKGAAAAAAMDRNKQGATVVSKFVRDILQDNANLQMGIVELRDMLENSNQEVENLREQILQHQPLATESDQQQQQSNTRLDEELGAKSPRRISQEFHVHHHYHSPSSSSATPKKDKVHVNRRPKRKRPVLNTAPMQPGTQPSRTSLHRPQHSSSSTSTIMSQTSVTIPSSGRRYSLPSPGASSLASSPQSAYRPSSIFDIMDHEFDSSRPTSPESVGFASPARRQKRFSDVSCRSISSLAGLQTPYPDEDDEQIMRRDNEEDVIPTDHIGINEDVWLPPAIPEEQEEAPSTTGQGQDSGNETVVDVSLGPDTEEDTFSPVQFHTLRKSTSHESLLSISGMDIHTLRDRPSQLLMGMNSRYFARRPQRIISAGTELSSTPPVISATNITADKGSICSTSRKSSHSLLATVAASSAPGNSGSGTMDEIHEDARSTSSSTSVPVPGKAAAITRRVGGWVLGRWGVAPSLSSGDLQSQTTLNTSTSSAASVMTTSSQSPEATASTARTKIASNHAPFAPPLIMRAPGVNQKGPILGLRPPAPAPISVHAKVLNDELLQESLKES